MRERPMGFARPESGQHGVRPFDVPLPDFRHMICEGMTGSGKTSSVVMPLLEDRIARGHDVVFYAYKGHEHQRVKALAKRHGRLEEVREIGKPHGTALNLMGMFSLEMVRQTVFELCGGGTTKDLYWASAASTFAESIVEILRALHRLYRAVQPFEGKEKAEELLTLHLDRESVYPAQRHEPSFADLFSIIRSSLKFNRFFVALEKLERQLNRQATVYRSRVSAGLSSSRELGAFVKAQVRFQEARERAGTPQLDKDDSNPSGNNGVRQILENGLRSLAGKDYVNQGTTEILRPGTILIVDIEGIDAVAHGILFETMLARLAARTRESDAPRPWSLFVDEANRVLPQKADLHNDVLREARVELIVAYQNSRQMLLKFGQLPWEAFRENFARHYTLEPGFVLHTTHEGRSLGRHPVALHTFGEHEALEADRDFHTLAWNREPFERRFLFDAPLPRRFHTRYDPKNFATDSLVILVDETGEEIVAEYFGEEGVRRYRRGMCRRGSQKEMRETLEKETIPVPPIFENPCESL